MNLVGKIFTFVIFAMSLAFMTAAVCVYGTHKNWRLVVDNATTTPKHPLGLSQQLDQKKKDNEALAAERDKATTDLKREKDTGEQARGKLENAVVEYRKEVEGLKKTAEGLDAQLRVALADLKNSHDELARRRTEVETLRGDIRKAEKDRDDHFAQVVKLTDELHQAANQIALLKAQNAEIAREHAKALEVLRKFDLKPEPTLYEKEPPRVDSIVTAVLPNDIVEIKLGFDDGIRPGHQFEVTRIAGGTMTYVGRIEVVKTSAGSSVCKILREFLKSPIQQGDRVDSKQTRPQLKG